MRWEAGTLVLLVVAAGCIGATATQSSDGLQANAESAVTDHVDDPALVEVWGVEPPLEVEEDDEHLVTHLNEEPGDGNAPGWGYQFVGDERASVILTATEIGVLVEYSENKSDHHDDLIPLEEWTVSSNEAASTLQANETWPEMKDDTAVVWRLAMETVDEEEDPKPVWMSLAFLGPSDDNEVALGIVDAVTGEILEAQHGEDEAPSAPGEPVPPDEDAGDGGCDTDQDSGTITSLNELHVSVELDEPGTLVLPVDVTGAGELDWTVQRDGETVTDETILVPGQASFAFDADVPDGNYDATLSTSTGTFYGELSAYAAWGHGGDCPPPGQGNALLEHSTVEGLLTETAPPSANLPAQTQAEAPVLR